MTDGISLFKNKFDEALALPDVGEQLLALIPLEEEIRAEKSALIDEYSQLTEKRENTVHQAGILTAGVSMVAAVGSISLFGPLGCILVMLPGYGVGASMSVSCDSYVPLLWKKDCKRRESQIAEWTKLHSEVGGKADFILLQEDLKTLAASAKYEDMLRSFPTLHERFEAVVREDQARPRREAALRAEKEQMEKLRQAVLKSGAVPRKNPPAGPLGF